jgi:hypothetical protein
MAPQIGARLVKNPPPGHEPAGNSPREADHAEGVKHLGGPLDDGVG